MIPCPTSREPLKRRVRVGAQNHKRKPGSDSEKPCQSKTHWDVDQDGMLGDPKSNTRGRGTSATPWDFSFKSPLKARNAACTCFPVARAPSPPPTFGGGLSSNLQPCEISSRTLRAIPALNEPICQSRRYDRYNIGRHCPQPNRTRICNRCNTIKLKPIAQALARTCFHNEQTQTACFGIPCKKNKKSCLEETPESARLALGEKGKPSKPGTAGAFLHLFMLVDDENCFGLWSSGADS